MLTPAAKNPEFSTSTFHLILQSFRHRTPITDLSQPMSSHHCSAESASTVSHPASRDRSPQSPSTIHWHACLVLACSWLTFAAVLHSACFAQTKPEQVGPPKTPQSQTSTALPKSIPPSTVPKASVEPSDNPPPTSQNDPSKTLTKLSEENGPFPTRGLLPKQEIQALSFLQRHPEYDGRGVVVAIFDSGVDPGAPGLQRTTDGQPKLIDLIDATGSGDVDISTIREPAEDGTIEGLSGRLLSLPEACRSGPSPRQVWIGLKAAYDLFPQGLVRRLKEDRKKAFAKKHRKLEAGLRGEILRWETEHPRPSAEEQKQAGELRERLTQLQDAWKDYQDPGPVIDCVVYRSQDHLWALIDTDADGDLAEELPLADYHIHQQYGTFGFGSELNFGVHIHLDARRLSIVVDASPHGTHVAGIVAGHFPDHPELNGIAPGARVISIKIADTRLGTMETGQALARGIKIAIDRKVDLINMSYGEPTTWPDQGALTELFSQAVNEHSIMFVASAGNSGPALSTVGAPGGTTSALLGVGAYLSPAMMAANYTSQRPGLETAYTWSSRGPSFDGDLGVDILAPGGAIAPVPHWTLRPSMPMAGTSMASPNACGALAALLSALKATKTPYSPWSVRRALQNTARRVEGLTPWAQGPGLLQLSAAFDSLQATTGTPGELLRLSAEVSVPHSTGFARGVYLREAHELGQPLQARVRFRPVFPDHISNGPKRNFQLRLSLSATAPWVQVGRHLLLTQAGHSITITVDPRALPPGAHFAEVTAWDAQRPTRGALFRLPVTVLVPKDPPLQVASTAAITQSRQSSATSQPKNTSANVPTWDPLQQQVPQQLAPQQLAPQQKRLPSRLIDLEGSTALDPGKVIRRFIVVPQGATWARVRLTTTANGPRKLFLHLVQRVPGASFAAHELRKRQEILPETPAIVQFPVVAGRTLEVCLAQDWSSLGETQLRYALTFEGLQPSQQQVTLSQGEPGAELSVGSFLRATLLKPQAKLSTQRSFLAPAESVLQPLTHPEDLLPGEQQPYQLLLTYRFTQAKGGTVSPRFPTLERLLYDSEVLSHLWLIKDQAKRQVAAGNIDPEEIELAAGTHTLQLELRHRDAAWLERQTQTLLALDRPLEEPIRLKITTHRAAALVEDPRSPSKTLRPGQQAEIFVVSASPSPAQLAVEPQGGDMLLGRIHYSLGSENQRHPTGFPLKMVLRAASPRSGDNRTGQELEGPNSMQERLRAKRAEFLIEQLQTLAGQGQPTQQAFEELSQAILGDFPDQKVAVWQAKLQRLDDDSQGRKDHLPEIIALCDQILGEIDQESLRQRQWNQGQNPGDKQDAQHATPSPRSWQNQREVLIDTLYRKGRALGYQELPDVVAKYPIEDQAEHHRLFEAAVAELGKWVDTTKLDYFLLHIRRDRRRGDRGAALKLLNRYIRTSPPTYFYYKKRRDLYQELGWDCWYQYESHWLIRRFPAADNDFSDRSSRLQQNSNN